jgi:hypothetical protein
MKESRKHQRIPFLGPLRISWIDPTGEPRFAIAKCIDVSEAGLRIEVAANIPLRTALTLNVERLQLSGPASVKHVERRGAKFLLGLELSQALQQKALAALREPWAMRTDNHIA